MALPDVGLATAEGRLLKLLRNEWELYDGVDVPTDSQLSLFDILLSIMMNSRLDTADKVRSIWNGKADVEQALGRVPAGVALSDEVIPWDALRELFVAFCSIRWAGPAVATKILHKKRPALIPILDSVIVDHLHPYLPPELQRGQPDPVYMVEKLKLFREMLLEHRHRVEQLSECCAAQGYPITPVRVLEILLWTQWEPRGYYRQNAD